MSQTKAQIKGSMLAAIVPLMAGVAALRGRVQHVEANVVSNTGIMGDLARIESAAQDLQSAAETIEGEAVMPEPAEETSPVAVEPGAVTTPTSIDTNPALTVETAPPAETSPDSPAPAVDSGPESTDNTAATDSGTRSTRK